MRVYRPSQTLELFSQGLNIEVGPSIASQSRGPVLKKQESLVVGAVRPLLFEHHSSVFYFHSNFHFHSIFTSIRIITSIQSQRALDSLFQCQNNQEKHKVLPCFREHSQSHS